MESEEIKTTKGDKIFWAIFTVIILGTIFGTFYRTVILNDFQVVAETPCDSNIENCFVRLVEPEPCTEEDTECLTNTQAEEVEFYKIIEKNASEIKACQESEEQANCGEALTCAEGEEDCSYTLCSEDILPEEEFCSDDFIEPTINEEENVDSSDEVTTSTTSTDTSETIEE